jgi:HK97 family phage portal protein
MTIFSTFRSWFGQGSTGQTSGVQRSEPFILSSEVATPVVGQDRALTLSAIWAAVKLLSENVASLPWFVYDVDSKGMRTINRTETLYQLLHERPNQRMTSMEFWSTMFLNFFFRGNAYALKQTNGIGEVIQLWPLASDQVEVEVLRDGSTIYKYYYDGKVTIYSSESIFHLKDTGNGTMGMDRLEFMRQSLGIALGANNQTARTFARDSKRPGVFSIDKTLTPTQREEVRQNFAGLQEGNSTELIVLEMGAKFDPLGLTPAEMQLLETKRFSVEEVGRWFGIPGVLINDTSKSTTWGTGIEQIIEGFYKFTLRSFIVNVEQSVRFRIMTPSQRARLSASMNVDALLRVSKEKRVALYATEVQNGLKTRNQCRQLEDEPPVPGGDIITVQANLLPIELLGKVKPQGASSDKPTEDAIAQ